MKTITQPGVLAIVQARAAAVRPVTPWWSSPPRQGRYRDWRRDQRSATRKRLKRYFAKLRRQAIRLQRALGK
jgi:hypothetical protein